MLQRYLDVEQQYVGQSTDSAIAALVKANPTDLSAVRIAQREGGGGTNALANTAPGRYLVISGGFLLYPRSAFPT